MLTAKHVVCEFEIFGLGSGAPETDWTGEIAALPDVLV